MRWDFFLFFASAVVTALGDIGLYIGVAGMTASLIHGPLKIVRSPRRLRMTIIVGMVVSGAAFLSLSAFYFKPAWFGLAQISPDGHVAEPAKQPPSNIIGPITGNKGIVTQDQKGDNKQ
jgi:hypothetical protein